MRKIPDKPPDDAEYHNPTGLWIATRRTRQASKLNRLAAGTRPRRKLQKQPALRQVDFPKPSFVANVESYSDPTARC